MQLIVETMNAFENVFRSLYCKGDGSVPAHVPAAVCMHTSMLSAWTLLLSTLPPSFLQPFLQQYVVLVLGLCSISAPANPESRHFFGNPAKFGSGQISKPDFPDLVDASAAAVRSVNWIKLMQLVLAVLIVVIRAKLIQNSLPFTHFVRTGKQGCKSRNKGSTELYCLFVAPGSIVNASSFVTHQAYCSVT